MLRNVNIGVYYPPPVNGTQEFLEIAQAESTEMTATWEGVNRVFINQYILTADVWGIKRLEGTFGILANPGTESLEFRRQRLLLRMRTQMPFTIRYMKQWLRDAVGENRYRLWVENKAYMLYIETPAFDAIWNQEVQAFVSGIKPANLAVTHIGKSEVSSKIFAAAKAGTRISRSVAAARNRRPAGRAVFTGQGARLLAKQQAGTVVTRAVLGAGFVDPVDLEAQTGVPEPIGEMEFGPRERLDGGLVRIALRLSNEALTETALVRQVGVFAQDPDEGEILYQLLPYETPLPFPSLKANRGVPLPFEAQVEMQFSDSESAVLPPASW